MRIRRLLPDSVAGRALLVLLAGLAVSHLASTAMYFTEGHEALTFMDERRMAERIAIVTHLAERTPAAERPGVLAAVDSPSLRVAWSEQSAIPDGDGAGSSPRLLRFVLMAELGDRAAGGIRVDYANSAPGRRAAAGGGMPYVMQADMQRMMARMMAAGGGGAAGAGHESMRRMTEGMSAGPGRAGTVLASVRLPDSSWLNFSAPLDIPRPFSSLRFVLSMAIMLLGVLALSMWAARRLAAPLGTFARAAERLGVDVNAPRLPETGPREVRRAAHAFNEMQGRIRRFVEDRTQMVAAIAHDLGTPITRLRLRADYVADAEQQRKMLADLAEMEAMIAATLSFVRDDAADEPRARFDLVSLLASVCDGMADTGRAVEFQAEGRLPYDCRPAALRRAFTNLIDNAVKYGARARVSLIEEPGVVRVRIDDDGPGIGQEFQEDVFQPFRRLEGSRSRETGGTGLGLTVARTIVRAHGGEIRLENRAEGGLRVEVALPR